MKRDFYNDIKNSYLYDIIKKITKKRKISHIFRTYIYEDVTNKLTNGGEDNGRMSGHTSGTAYR